MEIMLHKGNIYLFGIWQCVCVHWVNVFIFLDIYLVFGSVYLPLKMGVNGDHASKGWQSQHWLDLINFLRRRLVHGQDVHDANLHAEFSCSREYQGKPVSPYSLIAMNIYMFQNITNTWFKVWKCCSKHSSSDSIPVKITLTFRLFQQIDALIWLRFDWSVIKGANLNMHLQTGANFFLSYSVAGPLDLNLCVC